MNKIKSEKKASKKASKNALISDPGFYRLGISSCENRSRVSAGILLFPSPAFFFTLFSFPQHVYNRQS
ncbi:hypothetical protein MSSIT_2843 [Methanosarcina siciliae T4/M]|uniref:Uncharacterized protein n=1 Tax=Methanosarcina siciliae T4/M TaxID=1434120 RepID=A0A0E3P6W8_9EURY|nr:hypothetical protein MSSIT_2843 [Methanosarcina siciliae T4/M]